MQDTHNPYAAPNAVVIPELPPLPDRAARPELAGRGERLLAKIVDRLLYIACFLPFFVAALMHEGPGLGAVAGMAAFLGFAAMLGLFVYNLALLGQSGQTLGKRWLGIRIVRNDGSAADLGRLFGLRMALPWLIAVFVGPLFTLPDVLCIFGREQRCLHDLMADTIVIVA
jgi:uncharacterized RDD family membrane protein YckC